MSATESLLDPAELNRLKWRCRRGMLENDVLIERFFQRQQGRLTAAQAQGLQLLIDLSDPDLLDLLLGRREPQGELDCESVRCVLPLLKAPIQETDPTH